ncbi:MAG: hypothetical protein K2G37_02000 [Clostridia bacterium]|nr:hypothetical protein [Clostridia bacterium]MDE7329319.1 hypothetical protein [Clostridia bacterium]
MSEERNCENYRYFKAHYCEYGGRYIKMARGHCINSKLSYSSSSSRVEKNVACDMWEPYELQVLEEKEKIENVLRKMQKSLSQIQQILEQENRD